MKSFRCPHCKSHRAMSLGPIVTFGPGKKRPTHKIIGYFVQCFDCSRKFEVDKDGASAPKPKSEPKIEPESKRKERDTDKERLTEASLRSQGPLVPKQRPEY